MKNLWNHIKWIYFRLVLGILRHCAPVYQPATYYYIVQCSNLGLVVASCLAHWVEIQFKWAFLLSPPAFTSHRLDFLVMQFNSWRGLTPNMQLIHASFTYSKWNMWLILTFLALKMMVKSDLEKTLLKFLYVQSLFCKIFNCKFSNENYLLCV